MFEVSYSIVPKNLAFYCTRPMFWLREGNDNPHWMDYQRCKHLLPILYTLRPEGIRCYFANYVSGPINIRIDLSPIGCPVQSTLDPLAAKSIFSVIVGVPDRQRVQVQETGFASIGLFGELD